MLVIIGIFMGILLSIVGLDYYEDQHSVDCIFDSDDVVTSLSDFVNNLGSCKTETPN